MNKGKVLLFCFFFFFFIRLLIPVNRYCQNILTFNLTLSYSQNNIIIFANKLLLTIICILDLYIYHIRFRKIHLRTIL